MKTYALRVKATEAGCRVFPACIFGTVLATQMVASYVYRIKGYGLETTILADVHYNLTVVTRRPNL